MINKFPFSWEDIHTHFPKENVASIRKNLMEEYRSGKYSDSELMGRYHMSKDAFYNSVEELKKKQAKFEADMEVPGKMDSLNVI